MYFSTNPSALVLPLLLATQTFAEGPGCYPGTRGKKGTLGPATRCNFKAPNTWFCGSSGTSVVHKQTRVFVRAGTEDVTISIQCPDGTKNNYFHCLAKEWTRFIVPECKNGAAVVYSIKDDTWSDPVPNLFG